MRYFSYNEYAGPDKNEIVTLSEEDIRKSYYPYWQSRMKEASKDLSQYEFEDCLYDWIAINWAWEVKEEPESTD